MRYLRAVPAALLLLASLIAVLPARADEVPEDATWTQKWFASKDGTMLHADVFLPKDRKKNEKHPVILAIGPYFGSGGFVPPTPTEQGPVMRFQDLIDEGKIFKRGYAYIQVDSRGYGGSDGCYDLGGKGEQMDAKAAVEWAAKQKWSNGRVAMWGKSYDAWTQVMALAQKPKGLAATVIQSPLIEGYRGFFMNGVHYDAGWYATPGLYGGYDVIPPSVNDSPPEEYLYPAQGTATNPDCYAENMSMTAINDHSSPYWAERNIVKRAAKSRVPVLWSHGFLDANTKADNFLPVWKHLRGPKRAWFGQYDHVRGNEDEFVGRDGFMNEAMAWLDHFTRRKPLPRMYPVEVQDGEGKWRTEQSWPPRDAKSYPLRVAKGSYEDQRGNDADGGGVGAWTFTQKAPYDLHFAGAPRLKIRVDSVVPDVNLIALLYDIDAQGRGKLITRGASLVSDGGATFDLYPQDWKLRKGHRFGLLLSGSDESWFSPIPTNTTVEVDGGSLDLSFLRYARTPNLKGGPADAQASVPTLEVDQDTIKGAETKTKFPPRMKRR
jgi:predicted acyl esterase